MNQKFHQGYYTVKNKDKYLGDVNNVVYRSSWELGVFEFCDNNKHILKWCSEEIAIPYLKPNPRAKSPKDMYKKAMYYPDVFVVYERNGQIQRDLIEIKPLKQTKASKARNPLNKQVENFAYLVNEHKWDAAVKWCKPKGINFRVLTENDSLL